VIWFRNCMGFWNGMDPGMYVGVHLKEGKITRQ
jgi:hypothetical protein